MADLLPELRTDFLLRVTAKAGNLARRRFMELCASQQLRRSMVIVRYSDQRVSVYVPQYWARFYHDGRGSVRAAPGKKLVFWFREFRDNDPRLKDGYPIRAADIIRLTRNQYAQLLFSPNDVGGEEFAIVESVGPAPAHPFFRRGGVGMAERQAPMISDEFSQHVTRDLPGINGFERDSADCLL